ncbi:MAG: DUF664 domain-containing protein [Chloroflexi bacterium]|nr:DUF664 domain-containing protein [Chloroflexota bacterium]
MAEKEANELRRLMETDLREMALLLAGISDANAGVRRQPGDWSIKDILAHLSEVARSRFLGVGEVQRDPDHVLLPSEANQIPEKLAAIVATCGTVAALVGRCRADFEDIANLVEALPSETLARTAKRRSGTTVVEVTLFAWLRAAFAEHFQEHVTQARAIRERQRA